MLIRALSCVAGATVLAASASAVDTVRAQFVSVAPGVGCEFSIDSGSNWTGTTAGAMNWLRDAGSPGTYAGLQGAFATFCIEVTQHVGYGSTYDYYVNTVANAPLPADGLFGLPMGAVKADKISELYGRHYAGLSGNTDFAAFQMAVWEIVYDDATDVTGGVFQVRNAATEEALANAWLATIDGTGPRTGGLFALSSDDVQDQIVPTPGSLALFGLGGLMVSRRRR